MIDPRELNRGMGGTVEGLHVSNVREPLPLNFPINPFLRSLHLRAVEAERGMHRADIIYSPSWRNAAPSSSAHELVKLITSWLIIRDTLPHRGVRE